MNPRNEIIASERDYEARREELGARVRALRLEKSMTGRGLAAAAEISQSKISKIETGQQLPSSADLAKLGAALSLPARATNKLVREAHTLANEFLTWDHAGPRGLRRRQESIAALEGRTDSIRTFEPLLVPGLLQTAAYAQIIMRHSAGYAEDDVEAGVVARLGRQAILFSGEHSFEFVLHESALRSRLGTAKIMRAQIDRLRNLATLPSVALMVIPWQAQLPVAPMVGFTAYDDQLVSIETPSNRGEIRRPRDIATYLEAFSALKIVALGDGAAMDLLAKLDDKYRALEDTHD